jgi:hypothetical protein
MARDDNYSPDPDEQMNGEDDDDFIDESGPTAAQKGKGKANGQVGPLSDPSQFWILTG